MSHEIGISRTLRMFVLAESNTAGRDLASDQRAAGVEEQITCTQTPGEPGKPCRILRLVTGGALCQGKTGGEDLCASGWLVGA